ALPARGSWRRPVAAATAGGLALLAVLIAVAFGEWRTRRVAGAEQVVADLGLRLIGTVPAFPSRAKLAAAGGSGDADWRFALNEAVNSTRTMLLHAARNHGMQVVMVTSATQGEGKTSLAGQLAASMAGSGMRTLLVDCDLRNPSVHTLFDLGEPAAGVGEVLCQEADPADAVVPTAIPNLWAVPAGRCSARVVAAVAQGRPLEDLFNRLRGQFDFILVDSCPVLPVADALLVGQHVDGVVFAVMQDVSQVPQVRVASDRLAQLNVPLLGAVVNGVRPGPGYHAYGYNYVKQLPA
ncbi:MAG: CpsD/CapB family tyrosine-protein kinase, partial [Gemmataceae bacterium]|nr:CpsD/CapB family tyrosine-protein kinase [Gemmataceae bacterium]